ncbi:MAG: CCGSCS motif protein [Colwellia sp.]|nr:CCGSCS motif protein [Colwellia sp.]
MFKLFKSKKENHQERQLNEIVNSNSDIDEVKENQQSSPKKHGSDGVCCGGCGGE